jgi:agmatine/peptidylarginine deiminase
MQNLIARIVIIPSHPQSEHDAVLPFPYHLTTEEILSAREIGMDFLDDRWHHPLVTTNERFAPTDVIRPIAEFDQKWGVLIRYPLGIPLELVRVMSLETRVLTIVGSTAIRAQAINAYTGAGVQMSNCDFIIAPTDSYWTRDYGPWFSMSANGSLNVINFHYNRPRQNDNAFMAAYAMYDTLSIYHMNITHCGGNYMTDGISIAASSHIAYTENGNNVALVNQRMRDFLGIETYHVVPDPNDTYIDHIDCWGKFLSPDKILIRSVPPAHPRYTAIENTASYFASQLSSYGTPFHIYRVNTPQNQPYTNSLILNQSVFVPIMGNSTHDNAALQVYADAMPGYTIYGVQNNTINPWQSTDALHCRVLDIAEKRVIYIEHTPLVASMPWQSDIDIPVSIYSFTGFSLNPDSLYIYFRINDGSYQVQPLVPHPVYVDDYMATISGVTPGDVLYYYIRAVDVSGRIATHPFIGSPQAHRVAIETTTAPPIIVHTPITTINAENMPLYISAQVHSDVGVSGVFLDYFINAETVVHTIEMTWDYQDIYACLLDFPIDAATTISYRIRAHDISNPPLITVNPTTGHWHEICVVCSDDSDDVLLPVSLRSEIYPNPLLLSKGSHLNMIVSAHFAGDMVIEVYNIKGQRVYQKRHQLQKNELNPIKINISELSLSNGVYFIRFSEQGFIETRKVMILK